MSHDDNLELRLSSPLPCWHESLASARTDPVVLLSANGVFIQTDRPVPIGTALFLELSLGQTLGADKGEIDAVAEGTRGEVTGFFARFLRVDDKARRFIDAQLAQLSAAPPPPPLPPSLPAALHLTPQPLAVDTTAPMLRAPAREDDGFSIPPVTPAPILDLPALTPAPAPPPLTSAAVELRDDDTAPLPPAPEEFSELPRTTIPQDPAPHPAAAMTPDLQETTQRWAVAPRPSRLAADDALAAEPPALGDPDLTQPWSRAGGDSIPPRPLPPPTGADDERVEETTKWARATLTPARVPTPAPARPSALLSPLSASSAPMPRMASLDVPGGLPPQQSFEETMRWPTAQVRVAQAPLEMPVGETPSAPPPDLDALPDDAPAADDFGAMFESPLGALAETAPENAPEARQTAPAAAMDPEQAHLPTAHLPTAHFPTAHFPTLLADIPPALLMDEPRAPAARGFDAPADVSATPRLDSSPPAPPEPAIDAFGPAGAFLGGDDDDPFGGNAALPALDPDAMPEDVTEDVADAIPEEVAEEIDDDGPEEPPEQATEAGFGEVTDPGRHQRAAVVVTEEDPDEPPAEAETVDLQPTVEGSDFEDDAIAVHSGDLDGFKDVLGAPVPAPAAAAAAPLAALPDGDEDLIVTATMPAHAQLRLAEEARPSDEQDEAPALDVAPAPAATGSPAAAAPVASPNAMMQQTSTLPYYALGALPTAAAPPTTTPPSPVPPPRTTDPLFPAFELPPLPPLPPPPQPIGVLPMGAQPVSALPMQTQLQIPVQTAPPTLPAPQPQPPPTLSPMPAAAQSPRTLLFAAADVNAAVARAAPPLPAIADAGLLGNGAPDLNMPLGGTPLPAAVLEQLPGDDAFELAFEMAEPPPRAASHEPTQWQVEQQQPAAAATPEEDDLPLVVGDADLPVVVGSNSPGPSAADDPFPDSWVVPGQKKP